MEKNVILATDLILILQSAIGKHGDKCVVKLSMDEGRYEERAELLVSSSDEIENYEKSNSTQRNALIDNGVVIRLVEDEIFHESPNW